MEDLTQCEDAFNEYNDNREETFNEIRKNLLDDFETAKTVSKALKDGSKLSSISGEREPVKVYLRVRPFTNKEVTAGESQQCLEIVNSSCVFMHPPKTSFTFKHQSRNPITAETIHRFSFSHVFGPDTSQKTFFEDTSLGVVKDFIDGQNCLIFSYGVTNAGKTYTILGNGQNLGILPRTINILFNSFKDQNYKHANLKPKMFCDVVKLSSIQEEREDSKKKMLLSLVDVPTYHNSISSTDLSLQDISQEQSSNEVLDAINLSSLLDVTSVDVDIQGPIQFSLWISFAEIYNEHIYDLLEPISVSKEKRRTVLKVGDDRKGNPYIKGLTEIHVNNADEAMKLLKIGRKNQKIASTKLNENSSRSHCIFTLKILRVVNTKEPHVARVSRLSFVDLAGSERYTKTKNTGVRLKEAGNINTSIMTLGKCVELLRYNQNHANNPRNIPFRESKLTRLFQGFFCGKGKAQMIVNVNQCASAFDETLHALKFSAIAKKVTTMVQAAQPPPAEANDPVPRCARTSVIWADGSLSTPAGNKARTEIDGDDDDMAPLAEEEKTDVSEHTSQELEALVKILQGQLIQEKKNMALLEVKIREEVCQEMAEQMVEIENNYNERLMEDQRMHEDLYEKRMDLLAKSVKKSRKRPRVDRIEDDDDEWVSSVCLHKEQVKVQEFKEEINTLQQQLKETEESKSKEVEWFKKELSNRNEKVKSLEQTVEECKTEVENGLKELEKARNHEKNCTETLEIKIDDYKVEMERQLAGRNERITSLERTVKEYKSELESKTSQLLAAKKVHGGRTTTPTKTTGSNNIMKQLEKRLEETTAALDKKNSQLIDKNNVIAKLENSLKDAKDDLNEREKELDEVRGKLQLSSAEKENIETYENKINEMNEKLKEKEAIVGIKTKEVEEAVESLKFVEGELEILACKDKENQKEITKLRQDQKEMKESYEQEKVHLEDKLAEKEGAVKGMENTLKEAQSATGDSQAKIEEFRNTVEEKESELLRFEVKLKHSEEIINGLRKQIIEMQEDNKELQEKFTRALADLANTQAIVNARNQELEHFESLDKSLKDAYRDKETEIMQLKRELENTRNQLQNKENDFNHIKDEIEKRKHEEILKVNENWGSATERLKIGLLEQDETLAQMEKELLEKENELNDLRQQAEKLLKDNDEKKRKLENLSQENESLDDQTERLKIRVFELETEVEKLQQEVKKETSKKDTATASLRDGLEIIKTKKAEYESKIETISKEKEDMKTSYESRISELEGEIVRLKSGSCESSDDKTTSDKEAEPIRSSDGDDTYKAVEVESFNLPQKDRVEIDVTPITGSGLVKGGKKTASTKTKTMKRKSSDLTLKEIQDQLSAKSKRTNDFSEDDFTPVSVTKLRKTRSSSIANRSRQSRTNLFPSPSTCSLTTWKENSENTDPLQAKPSRSSQKSSSSGRRKFFHKLGLPENGKSKNEKSSIASQNTSKEMLSSVAPVKKRRRKLLKKTEISAPFTESPLPLSDKLDTPTPASRAQELITRHLRSRVVKTAR